MGIMNVITLGRRCSHEWVRIKVSVEGITISNFARVIFTSMVTHLTTYYNDKMQSSS